jgi:hypothetical protein
MITEPARGLDSNCGGGTLSRLADGAVIRHRYCRSWFCSVCYPRNIRRLLRHILAGRRPGERWRLIIYTISRHIGCSPDDRAYLIKEAHGKLRKRILRRYGDDAYEFIAVWETHQDGEPHLNVLQRGAYIDQDWLSDQWADLLPGSIIVGIEHVEAADRRRVAGYMVKDPAQFGYKTKRFWGTRRWRAAS